VTAYWINTFRSISDQAKLEAYIAPGSTPGKPCSTPPSWPPPDHPFCPYQKRPTWKSRADRRQPHAHIPNGPTHPRSITPRMRAGGSRLSGGRS